MRLYRAADEGRIERGHSLTPDIDAARAYLADPGFGGARLWTLDLEPEYVLDVRGECEIDRVLDEIQADEETRDRIQAQGYLSVGVLLAEERAIRERLQGDYDWIVYTDDYPEDAVTYWYLGDGSYQARELI